MDRDRDDRADAEWREAYRRLQTSGDAGCPDDDALATLVVDSDPTDARQALGDHVATCRRCSGRLRDLFDLHAAAGEPAADRGRRLPTLLAPVAAILLIGLASVSAWLIVGRSGLDSPAALRGDEAPASAVSPPDAAVLVATPTALEFPPTVSGAVARVVLMDDEGSVLWESDWLEGGRADLPDEVVETLEPGATYLWRVESLAGVERGLSPLHRFSLAP